MYQLIIICSSFICDDLTLIVAYMNDICVADDIGMVSYFRASEISVMPYFRASETRGNFFEMIPKTEKWCPIFRQDALTLFIFLY
jgi:hypothetical protein